MIKKSADEKLSTVKSTADSQSHLHPKNDDCINCKEKACTFVCPANVYEWTEEKKCLIVNYENCLECGACRIACPKQSLGWKYPRSNFGITYKQG